MDLVWDGAGRELRAHRGRAHQVDPRQAPVGAGRHRPHHDAPGRRLFPQGGPVSLKARILIGFLALFGAAFYFIADSIIKEMRPRYLEAVEESLNDTANTLASLMETQVRNGRLARPLLGDFFAQARRPLLLGADIRLPQDRVGLNVYVTDDRGTVIFDSRGDETLGQDFSQWNDVYHTLRGTYGARSTRVDPKDPTSSMLFVAAPIRTRRRHHRRTHGDQAAGQRDPLHRDRQEEAPDLGRHLTAGAFALLSVVLSFWISRPLTRLRRYVAGSLRTDESARLPPLGSGRDTATWAGSSDRSGRSSRARSTSRNTCSPSPTSSRARSPPSGVVGAGPGRDAR